jgi:hypothetical protein
LVQLIATEVIPAFSGANCHDYGDNRRIHTLLPQTMVEKDLPGRNRIYGSIIKIKEGGNRQLIGNIITFEHDRPDQKSSTFLMFMEYSNFLGLHLSGLEMNMKRKGKKLL